MALTRTAQRRLAAVLALAGLGFVYARPLATGFLNDDYLFLEQARTVPLLDSLHRLGALGNYYRPLSRQLYFAALTPIAGGHAAVFHAVNGALFLGALVLLADLLLALVPVTAAAAGVLVFALLPFQRVVLTWVSCSQDLLALAGVLGALALHRRGRIVPALACALAALASKEAALPLAVVIAAWDRCVERRSWRDVARRAWPYAALTAAWGVLALAMRGSPAAAPLHFDASSLAAAYAHLVQSLAGIDHPPGFVAALARSGPDPFALVAFAIAAWLLSRADAPAATDAVNPPPAANAAGPRNAALAFGSVWLAAFTFVVWPVAWAWSSYYYTLAAVGAAVIVATLLRRAHAGAVLVLAAALLWLNAAGATVRAFSVSPRPWVWTSHLTPYYFDRAARLNQWLSGQLLEREREPAPDTRFFFATLPTFAGFQMGNGAHVRALFHQPGIAAHFFSEFSDSTAGDHPCRFLYWDGAELQPMYPRGDTFFQVGTDLLLLGRTPGALHAFRRGGAAGESRADLLYWGGWAELWSGHRDAAEGAWGALGFRDDSLAWYGLMQQAHDALGAGDSLLAKRKLFEAIRSGVGRPEAHAVLGQLLVRRQPKYGLLELLVASRLEPRDWMTRKDLAAGLAAVHMDDAARGELEVLLAQRPALRDDAQVAALRRELDARSPAPGDVVTF